METGDNLMYEENFDLTKIDPEVFESLPDEIQYELLTQYKEKLKNRKSATAVEFPEVLIKIISIHRVTLLLI